ncbi:MAG: hypothetical protein WBO04_04045 [Steroidobacteraceae bacterium]
MPAFERPARVRFVHDELVARGHVLRDPTLDSAEVLPRVHGGRYLAFLRTAWSQWLALDAANSSAQPFPSVWPVRTLRSDLEPANFIARRGHRGTTRAPISWVATAS